MVLRTVIGVIGGGLVMMVVTWGGLLIFLPGDTTLDDAVLYIDIGGVVGAVAGGILARRLARRPK
ncbi:MAG TPA: hypothetical protein VFA20_08960 [Myxococcaceae bacterium]|nr:hypothetical protein [Myxococcaceae bacterium]